jgi:hypothetical protein
LSHRPQRKEKNCLNCGATVAGKFCQVCGQENAEPKDTFMGLLQHFLYDITHFDGMFFQSLKLLLFKPGILTRKYIEGKRASYLNPIKMYVFTSAIFFIIFFTFLNPVKNLYDDSAEAKISSLEKVKHDLVTVRDSSEKPVNLEAMNSAIRETDSNIAVLSLKAEEEKKSMTNLKKSIGDSVLLRKQNFGITIDSGDLRSKATGGNGFMEGLSFSNVQAYQVYQQHLPDSQKDKMLKKAVLYRFIKMKEQGSEDRLEPVRALMERFIHSFPQLLFISLPIFALILNMLYFRRKQYFYVDHIIFTLHLFCATFIFILFIALCSKMVELTGLKLFSAISSLFVLLSFFYEYKALRNFYGQGRLKTIIKFLLLNMLAVMTLSLLVAALLIISAFQI